MSAPLGLHVSVLMAGCVRRAVMLGLSVGLCPRGPRFCGWLSVREVRAAVHVPGPDLKQASLCGIGAMAGARLPSVGARRLVTQPS